MVTIMQSVNSRSAYIIAFTRDPCRGGGGGYAVCVMSVEFKADINLKQLLHFAAELSTMISKCAQCYTIQVCEALNSHGYSVGISNITHESCGVAHEEHGAGRGVCYVKGTLSCSHAHM